MKTTGIAQRLSRLSVGQKLQLLFSLLLLPLLLLGWLFVTQSQKDISFSEAEAAGTRYLQSVWPLYVNVLEAGTNGQAPEPALQKQLEAATALYAGGMNATEAAGRMQQVYQDMLTKGAARALPLDATGAARTLITKIADGSNLTLDPDLDSYYVMDSITVKQVDVLELGHSLLRMAREYAGRDDLTTAEKAKFLVLTGRLQAAVDGVQNDLASAISGNPTGAVKAKLGKANEIFLALNTALLAQAAELGEDFSTSADASGKIAAFAQAHAAAMAQTNTYWLASSELMLQLVEARIAGFERKLWMNLGIVGVLCVLIAGLILLTLRTISANLLELNRAFEALANLDLTRRGRVRSADDIGQTLQRYNSTADVIGEVISSTQQSAISVSAATNELSSTMANITAISQRQETAMDEIVMAVTEASASAQNVTVKTRASNEITTTTFSRVNSIKNTLDRLNMSSREIEEARDLIDSISNKINLLSLNAAIEAARAGDAGRGFAVVADEVKKLAQRTSASTESIAQTIGTLKTNIEQASTELDDILHLLEDVRGNSESVVMAVHSQEAAVSQISGRVTEFRHELSQVSVNVNESKIASESIADAAEELSQQARRFRISSNV